MTEFFKNVSPIQFEGITSTNPLAFRHYDADRIIMGKSMKITCVLLRVIGITSVGLVQMSLVQEHLIVRGINRVM